MGDPSQLASVVEKGPWAAMVIILLWLAREVMGNLRQKQDKFEDALKENTVAVIKLTTELAQMEKALSALPKMQQDINEAHRKLRGEKDVRAESSG